MRAVAQRAKDESDIRDKAAQDSDAAVKALKDADRFLRQLQQKHEEQVMAFLGVLRRGGGRRKKGNCFIVTSIY